MVKYVMCQSEGQMKEVKRKRNVEEQREGEEEEEGSAGECHHREMVPAAEHYR